MKKLLVPSFTLFLTVVNASHSNLFSYVNNNGVNLMLCKNQSFPFCSFSEIAFVTSSVMIICNLYLLYPTIEFFWRFSNILYAVQLWHWQCVGGNKNITFKGIASYFLISHCLILSGLEHLHCRFYQLQITCTRQVLLPVNRMNTPLRPDHRSTRYIIVMKLRILCNLP